MDGKNNLFESEKGPQDFTSRAFSLRQLCETLCSLWFKGFFFTTENPEFRGGTPQRLSCWVVKL